ncbi:MAG TPA: hypothetical protein VJX73_11725 [Terracidiphilus sp.]|nr:hypothetical protein [Terracidiphilus sp.]
MIAKRFATISVTVALLITCAMQAKGADTISVVSGTYGGNCKAPVGNKTSFLAKACNGQTECNYKVDVSTIGDPAVGCRKDYVAKWRCGSSAAIHSATAAPEAGYGSIVKLACAATSSSPAITGAILLQQVLQVSAKANIFAAGHAKPEDPGGGGAGVMPPFVKFPAGPGKILTFTTVSGQVSCCGGGSTFNGPDGGTSYQTSVLPYKGISGITDTKRSMFLVGVFVSDTEPKDPAPKALNVTGTEGLASFSPLLQQLFFIGDGLTGTGTGSAQQFHVPANATRLFLGFVDASSFGGNHGYYDDNVGELTVALEVRNGSITSGGSPVSGTAPSSSGGPAPGAPSTGPPAGFKPCARNSGGSGGTWPCTGPAGTVVYLVLNGPLPSAPVTMFFTRDMAYSTAGSVSTPLMGSGLDYDASAPAALCMGNAPHTYWVGFIDTAGKIYPDQGQFTITGCP